MNRTQPGVAADDIDISTLWRAVARNKLPLALAVMVAGAATYGVLSTMKPLYTSTAQVLLENNESFYTKPRGEQVAADSGRIDEETVSSEVQVLRSRDLALKVASDMKLFENSAFAGAGGGLLSKIGLGGSQGRMPVEERVLSVFENSLTVYQVAKSRVIAVEFTSSNAKLSADIANGIADAFIAWKREGRVQVDAQASKSIGSKLVELRDIASKAEAELERFRAESGLVSGANNTTLNTQQLSEINTQLTLAQAQRGEARARADQIRRMLDRGDVDAAPDVIRSPLIQRLMEQRIRVEREQAELSPTLLPAHPRMRQLASELGGLKRQLREEASKVVRSLENEEQVANARFAALQNSLDALSKQAEQNGGATAKLRLLEREATSKRDLYEAYLNRYGDANALRDVGAVSSLVSRISTASPSSLPSFPKKGPITLLVMVATMLLGLALIILRELMSNRAPQARSANAFDARGQMEPQLAAQHGPGIAVSGGFGTIEPAAIAAAQAIRAHGQAQGQAQGQAKTPASGAVHMVSVGNLAQFLTRRAQSEPGFRTMLIDDRDADPRRLKGVAAVVQLGRALAETGASVVTIEWATSPGRLMDGLGLRREPGLVELTLGKATFEEVVCRDPDSRVQIIAMGTMPAEIDAMKPEINLILDALDETYDHILIDASAEDGETLLALTGGRIDAGVRIDGQMSTRSRHGGLPGGFLGIDAPAFDVISLKPGTDVGGEGQRVAVRQRQSGGEAAAL